jgi:hypothetical protein
MYVRQPVLAALFGRLDCDCAIATWLSFPEESGRKRR